ncbi:MAG: hypothetical protein ACFB50_10940 [Rubrobacteraceae bacterium]
MKNLQPQTLLVVLLGVVPLAVLCAGVVSFLLLSAGYGLLVWAVLPFVGVLVVVAVIGVFLGRAAGGRRRTGDPGEDEARDAKPRRWNDV